MFTGIIKEKGKINKVARQADGMRLGILCPEIIVGLSIGDSVAVDGCCLTVEQVEGNGFDAYISYQTLQDTTFNQLKPGAEVNLEPSLALGSEMGGHMVTGHVDAVGSIAEIDNRGNAFRLVIRLDKSYSPYIAPKGSIAVDGISMTVAEKGGGWFALAVIPHTYYNTTLNMKKIGSRVNIEVDIIARYVANYIGHYNKQEDQPLEEKLKKYGFI